MDAIYEDVMLSDPLEDEARFRKMIDEAIEYGLVKAYRKYTGEPDKKTKRRMEKAKKEEYEAVELARELGVHEKLFGKEGSDDGGKKGTKKGKDGDGEEALAALIQQRQKGRSESFLDNLEAKYGGGAAASKKTKKRQKDEADDEEPSEEAFQAAASRLKGNKKDTKAQAAAETNEEGDSTRRSKRTKK